MTTIKANGRDLELRTDQDIVFYPDQNIWIKQGTKLIFEGTVPDDFEAKLQATSVTADRDIILPDESGTLATQEWVNANGGGGGGSLNNVVEDTTPQLGGDLDVNGKNIVSAASNEDIAIIPSGTGKVTIEAGLKLNDQAITPTSAAGATVLYADTASGGGTGLFFVDGSTSDELVSKSKAIVYGLIF